MNYSARKRTIRILMGILVLWMIISITTKMFYRGYTLNSIIPQRTYRVKTTMSFTGNGQDLIVRTFLPKTNNYQKITQEVILAEGMNFHREQTPSYDRGDWSLENAQSFQQIEVTYQAKIQGVEYVIDPELKLPLHYPDRLHPYLQETQNIQSNHSEIRQIAQELTEGKRTAIEVIKALYDYVYDLGPKPFKGTTDALTALRLQEASCNGKSRLLSALARSQGIPSKLVGGLILNTGSKRTSHQWIELYIGGFWIPFDTLNGHFAKLPKNYLTLYFGDEVLFRHSSNIGFDYRFDIKSATITNEHLTSFLSNQESKLYNLVDNLIQGGFPLSLLQFLLVIPFGVLLVVFFKNVVGFRTYGTFLPALIAMSIQESGLQTGLLIFVVVIAITVLIRFPLDKLGILHTPKLAILMLAVITSLLGISALALNLEWGIFLNISATALLPIAILTITSERIALTISEEGLRKALIILIQTLIVTAACYLVMSSVALQAIVISFPEVILGVLAADLWIGSWTGIRIIEFFRFRSLIFKDKEIVYD